MMNESTLCIRVSDEKYCPYCKGSTVVKNGTTKNKKQQYHCKGCFQRFILNYTYLACHQNVNEHIILFTKEGLGIRSTARILKISTTTLLKRIVSIASSIHQPVISKGKTYEVDEMCTFYQLIK